MECLFLYENNENPTLTIENKGYVLGGGGSGVTAGAGVYPDGGGAGTRSTGSGGGGGGTGSPNPGTASFGGQGGSGIVAIRYQIGTTSSQPGAKATGGDISYNATNEQWIHTFTTSGTFATGPTWTAADVEYFIGGGGASGAGAGTGSYGGGGGGAGAVKVGTTPIAAHPVSTTIQVGGGGLGGHTPSSTAAINGTPSYFGAPITAAGGGHGGVNSQPSPGSPGTRGGNAVQGTGGGGGASGGSSGATSKG